MSAWQIVLLVSCILVSDFIVVGAILSLLGQTLRGLSKKHPPLEPLPSAVRRNFQSIRIDMLNLGFCVHIAVDERALHLFPSAIMRLLKLPGASIPWDAFSNVKRKNKSYAQARLEGSDVLLPLWAMRAGFPDIDRSEL